MKRVYPYAKLAGSMLNDYEARLIAAKTDTERRRIMRIAEKELKKEYGDELKKFNTYDGMGFKLLQEKGVKVGILTKEDRELNRRRARKLGLDFDFHGVDHKLDLVQKLCIELEITLDQVAYVGDDINDKALLNAVGLAACPSNAHKSIKSISGIIQLSRAGGAGAIRELVETYLVKDP